MSKVLFILTFLATSIAFAESAKSVKCVTSSQEIRFEGTETVSNDGSSDEYSYDGSFQLASPRSDRQYVVGDLFRDSGVIGISSNVPLKTFAAKANILVVDGTPCATSQQPDCALVDRATTAMLCNYTE